MDNKEHITEVTKMTPPVTVGMAGYFGFSLQDWMYIATILYIILQAAVLIYKTFMKNKRGE